MDDIYLELMKDICTAAGFTPKGRAFFRVVGDGVLQVVKCQYERRLHADFVYIGLHSMYSALHPRYFTATGCTARYSIVNCVEQNNRPQVCAPNQQMQLQMLQDQVVSWLNGLNTQKKLLSAISKLDNRWNDSTKIGPYLACGECNHAKKVIKAIIGDHAFSQIRKTAKCEETVDELLARVYNEQESCYGIIEIIDRGNDAIRTYLQTNYTKNIQRAKFCVPKQEAVSADANCSKNGL